jgi:hypothetical protein
LAIDLIRKMHCDNEFAPNGSQRQISIASRNQDFNGKAGGALSNVTGSRPRKVMA